VHQYSRVGRYSFIGGLAAVTKDVIPYGLVWGNHAHLEGLNLVGLKRRNFSRETITELRAAYRSLFAEEGTFQERIDDTAALRDQHHRAEDPPVTLGVRLVSVVDDDIAHAGQAAFVRGLAERAGIS
jgi:acyl-[acyl carrier protein]--UDP-N-acetylglucosamine O-acyltransferase